MANDRKKRDIPIRDERGRLVGYKGAGVTPEAKTEAWAEAEKEYRRAHKLPFTAKRKSYWDSSPREGVPSFRSWYKKRQAANSGKKKGQSNAAKKLMKAHKDVTGRVTY